MQITQPSKLDSTPNNKKITTKHHIKYHFLNKLYILLRILQHCKYTKFFIISKKYVFFYREEQSSVAILWLYIPYQLPK